METIENKIENLLEEENQTEIYTVEEAEEIRKEKILLYRELLTSMKAVGKILNFTDLIKIISKEVFRNLSDTEKEKHIFIHVFAGSTIKQESIFDEKDRKAEKMLKEELEKLKAEK
ncbi:hypothetical protein KAI52_03850 [Candidatus Parcubacteria bacterium]|nr:hypothetical protein [Candidatus Parcubacteria bacterium]